ncbi:MAG: peptidoglycan DD-metalloendopeptidase family protein [Calditrichia bacterium]|nr:peptidoglycan DD-metalloendopeptidase family protein [Calditrichia bacterium]
MRYLVFTLLILYSSILIAQENIDARLRQNRSQLDKIKSEIDKLQGEISKSDIKTSNLLKQIKHIDKEMGLISEVKRLLNNKNRLLSKKINIKKTALEDKIELLKRLKTLYINRCTHLYRYGKINNLELLFSSQSLNQALVRYKYLKYFAEQESKLIENIKTEISQIEEISKELNTTFVQQKNTIRIKEKEGQKYIANLDKKKVLVKKIKWNKSNLGKQLKEAEQNYKKLNSIIVTLEKKRKERERTKKTLPSYALNLKNFSKARGKLYWPVQGKVISKYGKQRNPILKTYIKNTGIDIKAKSGDKAKAVFNGLVSMITYLSGYGNTVIIDHGEGFYSVYSHLSDVLVEDDQYVKAGTTIGLVGESGSLDGAKLHFEIYAYEKTVDPMKWLRN